MIRGEELERCLHCSLMKLKEVKAATSLIRHHIHNSTATTIQLWGPGRTGKRALTRFWMERIRIEFPSCPIIEIDNTLYPKGTSSRTYSQDVFEMVRSKLKMGQQQRPAAAEEESSSSSSDGGGCDSDGEVNNEVTLKVHSRSIVRNIVEAFETEAANHRPLVVVINRFDLQLGCSKKFLYGILNLMADSEASIILITTTRSKSVELEKRIVSRYNPFYVYTGKTISVEPLMSAASVLVPAPQLRTDPDLPQALQSLADSGLGVSVLLHAAVAHRAQNYTLPFSKCVERVVDCSPSFPLTDGVLIVLGACVIAEESHATGQFTYDAVLRTIVSVDGHFPHCCQIPEVMWKSYWLQCFTFGMIKCVTPVLYQLTRCMDEVAWFCLKRMSENDKKCFEQFYFSVLAKRA
eukprot:PhF_6_TR43596/c0_g1_i1/m.66960